MFDSDSARYGVYFSVVVSGFLNKGRSDRPVYHVVAGYFTLLGDRRECFDHVASAYLQFVDDHRERVKYIYPRMVRNYEQLVESGYIEKLKKFGNPEELKKFGNPQDPPVRPRMTAWWDLYANLTYNFSVNRC